MKKREPTSGTNATSRLFLRFFLSYLIITPVAILTAMRGLLNLDLERAGLVEFSFIPLSLLGAFLTVTKPYLIVLAFIKSFYDVALLYQVSQWVRLGDRDPSLERVLSYFDLLDHIVLPCGGAR